MPIIGPGGPGGSSSPVFTGAIVTLAADQSVVSAATIPFDTVTVDTDSFFDAVSSSFVIPSAKGGLYILGAQILVNSGATGKTSMIAQLSANVAANTDLPAVLDTNDGAVMVGSILISITAGDTITPVVTYLGAGAISVQGGSNSSSFFLQYLGPLP